MTSLFTYLSEKATMMSGSVPRQTTKEGKVKTLGHEPLTGWSYGEALYPSWR